MTDGEARQLRADRQYAVRQAWKQEAERVRNGMGTRNWTKDEQAELLSRGSVKGYEGHHMISVANDRSLAGNPDNIQFLNRDEHINGAHQGDSHNLTNGYYNPETKSMETFENNELQPLPTVSLDNGPANAQGSGEEAAPENSPAPETGTLAETGESPGSGDGGGPDGSGPDDGEGQSL
jgi:hypothetical protein